MSFKKIFFTVFFLLLAFGSVNYFSLSDVDKKGIQKKITSLAESLLDNISTRSSSRTEIDASRIVPRLDTDTSTLVNQKSEASGTNEKIELKDNEEKSQIRHTIEEAENSSSIGSFSSLELGQNATKSINLDHQQLQNGTSPVAIDEIKKTNATNIVNGQGISEDHVGTTNGTIELFANHSKEDSVISYTSANEKGSGNSLRGKVTASASETDDNKTHGTAYVVAEDAVVQNSFIEDLASFLTANYWPRGEHPLAKNTSYSSVTLSWLNSRYGNSFKGIGEPSPEPTLEREKVLSYILTPAMVEALRILYGEKFVIALQKNGASRFANYPESKAYVAKLLTFYSQRMKAVSSALKGFLSAPEAREKAKLFSQAEASVQKAYQRYNEVRFSGKEDSSLYRISAKDYQTAIWVRDQAKTRLASVMRRSANTRLLSEGDITFIALWVSRRDNSSFEGIASFAEALDKTSLQMQKRAENL